MMYNKTLCFFIVLMFLLTGCYKDVIVIEDLRNTIGDTTQTSSSSKTNIVNIAPVVGGYTSSGASSVTEFQAGGIVQAFVFISGLQFLESPCFKSLKAGTLTPVSNPLELVSGEYYFYMTSTNSANYPPVFSDSYATAITSGKDYLWSKLVAGVYQSNTTLSFTLEHCASQIVINVENGNNTTSTAEWVNYATIASPIVTDSVRWNLMNGVITPATSVTRDSVVDMNLSGLQCNQVILPLNKVSEIYTYLSLKITDEDEPREYDLYLPIPDSTLKAGNSYHYTLNLSNDSVNVGSVEINPWVDVDEEGNPIIPYVESN